MEIKSLSLNQYISNQMQWIPEDWKRYFDNLSLFDECQGSPYGFRVYLVSAVFFKILWES